MRSSMSLEGSGFRERGSRDFDLAVMGVPPNEPLSSSLVSNGGSHWTVITITLGSVTLARVKIPSELLDAC